VKVREQHLLQQQLRQYDLRTRHYNTDVSTANGINYQAL